MATYERKCRSCGKWALNDGKPDEKCPSCRAPFGKIELGMDVLRDPGAEAVPTKVPKSQGYKEATKLPAPKPGEFGYRPTSPKRGAS